MPNLWRVLALAWLGGLASPALMDEPATLADAQPMPAVVQSAPDADPAGNEAIRLESDAVGTPSVGSQNSGEEGD